MRLALNTSSAASVRIASVASTSSPLSTRRIACLRDTDGSSITISFSAAPGDAAQLAADVLRKALHSQQIDPQLDGRQGIAYFVGHVRRHAADAGHARASLQQPAGRHRLPQAVERHRVHRRLVGLSACARDAISELGKFFV